MSVVGPDTHPTEGSCLVQGGAPCLEVCHAALKANCLKDIFIFKCTSSSEGKVHLATVLTFEIIRAEDGFRHTSCVQEVWYRSEW
jgi:hypothetical protein